MRYNQVDLLSGVRSDQKKILAVRSVVTALAMISVVASVKFLPIMIMLVILNTMPFMIVLLSYLMLAGKVFCFEIAAMIISYGAIVLIAY